MVLIEDFIIYGYKDTAAQVYANENGITFFELAENECQHNNTTEYAATEATCTTDGYTDGTYCEDCEKWISDHSIAPATGHDWETVVNPSTCKVQGVSCEICVDCDEIQNEKVLPLAEHSSILLETV